MSVILLLPCAHGRSQEHLHLATTCCIQTDDGLYVFQVIDFCFTALARACIQCQNECVVRRNRPADSKSRVKKSTRRSIRANTLIVKWMDKVASQREHNNNINNKCLPWLHHGTSLAMESRWNRSPGFGKRDHRTGIQNTETEEMIELESNAVHSPLESTFGVE